MRNSGRAFTFVEIAVTLTVMSMMMIAFIGFITYGSETFRRGKGKLDTVNYSRIVYDLLKEEMQHVTHVYKNAPLASGKMPDTLWNGPLADTLLHDSNDSVTSTFFYIRDIVNTVGYATQACFCIRLDPDSRCLFRDLVDDRYLRDGELVAIEPYAQEDGQKFDRKRWGRTRLARNVKGFQVTRRRAQAFQVFLEFGEDTDNDGVLDVSVSSHSILLLAPQLSD